MRRIAIALCGGVVRLVPTVAFAAPGEPDPGFGTNGVVTGGLLDEFGQVTVDGEGRTVVVGRESNSIAIARYPQMDRPTRRSRRRARRLPHPRRVCGVRRRARLTDVVHRGNRPATHHRDPFSNASGPPRCQTEGCPTPDTTPTAFDPGAGLHRHYETGSITADGSAVITEIGLGGGWLTTIDVGGVLMSTCSSSPPAPAAGCVPVGFGYRPFGSAASGNEAVHALDVGVGDNGGCTIENAIIVTKQNLDTDDPVWSYACSRPRSSRISAKACSS